MKNNIHLWQIEVVAWRPDLNLKEILKSIKNTPSWDLLILPEMAIPGYMIWDKWKSNSFIKECNEMNQDILDELKINWNSAIWWNISFDENAKNNDWSIKKFNSAFVAQNGELLKVYNKVLLPNYRMFDDKRYFSSWIEWLNKEEILKYFSPVELEIAWVKQKVSVLICEDIWNINWDYENDPVELSKSYNPDLIAVPSCSPFGLNKANFRNKLLQNQSRNTTISYVNPIWTQDNWKNIFAFDWGSAIYENGNFVKWIKDFTTSEVSNILTQKEEIEQIYETLIYTAKNFLQKRWNQKVVIGLSWWIDSAVVAAILKLSIWSENVIWVNMPSKFNSNTTKSLALDLAKNLEIDYKIFPIQESIDLKVKQITQTMWKSPTSFEIENIQARERWQILSDLSANIWWVFTNNWNKDETALGYATLYWDVSWALALIADLHKTQVFELARFINKKAWRELIPNWIINLKPSAELSDAQNPENGWGDPFNYEFTWKMVKAFTENKFTPTDILEFYKNWTLKQKLWFDKEILEYFENVESFIQEVEKYWNLLHKSYFKRVQAPPIVTISKSSFGFDNREAQIDAYLWRKYEKLKEEILAK